MRRIILPALLVSTLFVACGDEAAAPTPAATPAKAKTATAAVAAVDAGTTAAATTLYAYSPVAKRDPFRSPIEDKAAAGDMPVNCNDPLCTWISRSSRWSPR